MSEKPQIYTLLSKVMGDIGAVGKDSQNVQQGYKFRGIDAMLNAAHPALVKHGVFCCPEIQSVDSQERVVTNSQGKQTNYIRVAITMRYTFWAPDGSSVSVVTAGEGLDTSDKATNKAMSAAMKYALIQLFSIPTADMDDADRTSPEAGSPAKMPEGVKPQVYTRPAESSGMSTKAAAVVRGDVKKGASPFIEKGQAVALHRLFREALDPSIQKDADFFLKSFLHHHRIVDEKGAPSTLLIRSDSFDDVKTAVLEYAKQVNQSGNKEKQNASI